MATRFASRRVPIVVVIVLAAALSVSGVIIATEAAGTTSSTGSIRAFVALVGDSNEIFSAQYPASHLVDRSDGYALTNIARSGAGIRAPDCAHCTTGLFWRAKINALRDRLQPDAYVVNLGINDAFSPGTATTRGYASYGEKIDWLMALFAAKPVLWTNLPCDIEPLGMRHGCRVIDAALTAATSRWWNLHVVNWAAVANPHPEYIGGYLDDHLTKLGGAAWATLVGKALDARFPG